MSWAKVVELVAVAVIGFVAGVIAYRASREQHLEQPHTGGPTPRNERRRFYSELCAVCLQQDAVIELHPCGDVCLCEDCSASYTARTSSCPVCRNPINGATRV